jgi:predicted nucleotidyltransferase
MVEKNQNITYMDKTDALRIADEYAKVVAQHFDYRRMILFGSYAKGTFHKESDIDIAVVFGHYDNRFSMQVELMKLCRLVDSRIEPHPFMEEDFNMENPMALEIVKYGQDIN